MQTLFKNIFEALGEAKDVTQEKEHFETTVAEAEVGQIPNIEIRRKQNVQMTLF